MKQVEYISYGGGTPSLALIILNIKGEIKPITDRDKVDEIIFADTGWDRTDTMEQMLEIQKYVKAHGYNFKIVESNRGSLEKNLLDSLTDKNATFKNGSKINGFLPIPYHSRDKGIAQRQCTGVYKIQPINSYIRGKYGSVSRIAQLGIHYDEFYRVKEPKAKKDVNRFPLVDLKLRRADCIKIVAETGLPMPPKSACVGCPYLPASRFIELNHENPKDFERAERIDTLMNKQGKYLSGQRIPLASLKNQAVFPEILEDSSCESGYCFT
tara:strand:+ start:435 stop:1241 length:807 start_codon:yes stop_codon:yes gene_type:complete